MTSRLHAARLPLRMRARPLLADAALYGLFAAIVLLLTVSETLLDRLGYHYFTPGGAPWEKFHPGTLVAVVALGLRIVAAQAPVRTAMVVLGANRSVLLFLVAIGIAAAHAALVSHLPVTGLVDTFVGPIVFVCLLEGLDATWRRRLALLMCGLLALNACVGLVESVTDWRLVPADVVPGATADPTRVDVPFDPRAAIALDWRSRALLGHPLENAMVMGAFVLCLATPGARWLAPRVRFALLGLSALSLIPFGGRAALVLALAGALLFGLAAGARKLHDGLADVRRPLALACLAAPLVLAVCVGLAGSGFFDRSLERFSNDDGSANARVVMWQLFEPQSWAALLFAPDQALVDTWQRLLGIDFGIESFWLGLVLTYGLIVGVILAIGLGFFCFSVIRRSGPGATGVFLYFFLVASTSTSLSSKTVGFTIVILLIMLLLPRHPDARAEGQRAT